MIVLQFLTFILILFLFVPTLYTTLKTSSLWKLYNYTYSSWTCIVNANSSWSYWVFSLQFWVTQTYTCFMTAAFCQRIQQSAWPNCVVWCAHLYNNIECAWNTLINVIFTEGVYTTLKHFAHLFKWCDTYTFVAKSVSCTLSWATHLRCDAA